MASPTGLRYEPLAHHERVQGMMIAHEIATDPESLVGVDEFHAAGSRCAFVVHYDQGRLGENYVLREAELGREFPFDAVRQAVTSYDPADSLCVVLVRGRKVVALVTGRSGSPSAPVGAQRPGSPTQRGRPGGGRSRV